MHKPPLLIGCHLSIEGGFYKAIERANELHATCLQLFTKSNRQWQSKPISEQEAALFKQTLKESPTVQTVVAHASYLINCAAFDDAIWQKSIAGLVDELERCATLGIPYLVLHPGSAKTQDKQASITRVSQAINEALTRIPHLKTMLLLETMAGQGSVLGATFAEIHAIRAQVDQKKHVGACIDTCHVFAAGYDIGTSTGYARMKKEFDATIGLTHLKVIHVNDSKKECGSHVDRHEHIGKGKIGIEGFALLMNDADFFAIPKILETPKDNGLIDDRKNLETLCHLISAATLKKITLI
ncbi:MAG: deoxyribonuclease IV [Candidatus Babeliales bacterium]